MAGDGLCADIVAQFGKIILTIKRISFSLPPSKDPSWSAPSVSTRTSNPPSLYIISRPRKEWKGRYYWWWFRREESGERKRKRESSFSLSFERREKERARNAFFLPIKFSLSVRSFCTFTTSVFNQLTSKQTVWNDGYRAHLSLRSDTAH